MAKPLTLNLNNPSVALTLGTTVSQNIVITDDDFPSITYGGAGFTENPANDGSVSGEISATLVGDQFKDPLVIATDVAISNIPSGLTPSLSVKPSTAAWVSHPPAEVASWDSVAYGNGLFVAINSDGANRVMTSPDGVAHRYLWQWSVRGGSWREYRH